MVVERLVIRGDDPWDVLRRLPAALAVVELRVVRRRCVLQGRIQRGAQLGAGNPHRAVKAQVHDWCRIRLGLGRPGGLGPVDACPDRRLPERRSELRDLLRGKALQGGEVLPLVVERLQCGQVEKDRGAELA